MKMFLISVLFTFLCCVTGFSQTLYAPGGSANIQNSTTYAGIGTTAPLSLFHLQQPGSTWNDGLRLSLNGKDWNIVSTHNGARLALGFGQTAIMELHSDGAKPTINLQGDVTLKGKAVYFLGDAADPNYLIQSGLWSEGMMYKHFTSHRFFTNRREQMRIAFDGRIGINTTAPTGRLHVQQATAAWAEGIRLGFQAKNWDIVATNNGERLSIGAEESQGIELNSVTGAPAMAVKGTLEVRGDLQLGPKKAVYFLGGAADPEYLIQSGNWNEGMMYRRSIITINPEGLCKPCHLKG